MEALIESVDRLAWKYAIKFCRVTGRHWWKEDAYQAAKLASVRAAQGFNPEKGEFTTWASAYMNSAMLDLRHQLHALHVPDRAYGAMNAEDRAKCYSNSIYTSAKVKGIVNQDLTVEEALYGSLPEEADEADHDSLRRLTYKAITTSSLTERERRIVIQAYGLHGKPSCTYDQIGAKEGISRERVRQILVAAEKKLKRAFLRLVHDKANILPFL